MGGRPQFVDGGVGGDTVDPGGYFGLAFETGKAAADPGKDYLGHIFSVIGSHEPCKVIQYFRLKFCVDFFEFHLPPT
jgi:hypothetical protein